MTATFIPGVYHITPGYIRKSEKQKQIEAEIVKEKVAYARNRLKELKDSCAKSAKIEVVM